MARHISYTCPVCCASMIETDESEIKRLQGAIEFLVATLKKVQSRPGNESAFIVAVNLEHASKVYGVNVTPNAEVTGGPLAARPVD